MPSGRALAHLAVARGRELLVVVATPRPGPRMSYSGEIAAYCGRLTMVESLSKEL
jgi:hypothetical protein